MDIKCETHQEEVIMIELGEQHPKGSRLLCILCFSMGNEKNQKLIPIVQFLQKVQAYSQNQLREILSLQYNEEIKERKILIKLNKARKEKYFKNIDDLVEMAQSMHNYITKDIRDRLDFYVNILQNMTNNKLENIANMMCQQSKEIILFNLIKEHHLHFINTFKNIFPSLIQDKDQILIKIESILENQAKLLYQIDCKDVCYSLVCYKEQNIIIGGVDKNIYIWEQKDQQLIQSVILSGHTGWITSIVTCTIGQIFISSGWIKDNSIILWKNIDNQWILVQRSIEHLGGITDLQLSPNEDQLVSSSEDKTMKIWSLDKELGQLNCIQMIENKHNFWVQHVSFTFDQEYMVSSSSEYFFNIFHHKVKQTQWIKYQKLLTKGKIRRLHFIKNDYQLLCQSESPSNLMIYQMKSKNQLFEPLQKIKLYQSDDGYILFPMLQIDNIFYYLKNNHFVYQIKKSEEGYYQIEQVISGHYTSGCFDLTGKLLILGSIPNKNIDVYIQY